MLIGEAGVDTRDEAEAGDEAEGAVSMQSNTILPIDGLKLILKIE